MCEKKRRRYRPAEAKENDFHPRGSGDPFGKRSGFVAASTSAGWRVLSEVKLRTRWLLLSALLPLFSIATFAQSPPPAGAAYGAYPANYKELVTAWLNSSLGDPKSAEIKWLGEPRPGELDVGKGQKVAGFLVDFSVNARNIFGAPTGMQKHTALIRDGQVVTATGFRVQ